MSAPAIKSSMPGVGTPNSSTGHTTMLPMNMVSQKVTPSDQSSSSVKPLQNPTNNHNFVTLQTPGQPLSSQPLSLIQEHRPAYPTSFGNNIPTDQLQQVQQPSQSQSQLQQQPQQLQQQQPQLQPQQQPQQQPSQPIQPQQLKELEQHQHQDSIKMMQNGMEQSKEKHDGHSAPAHTPANPGTNITLPGSVSISNLSGASNTTSAVPMPSASSITPVLSNSTSESSGVSSASANVTSTGVSTVTPTAVTPTTAHSNTPVCTTSAVKSNSEEIKTNNSTVDSPLKELRPQELEKKDKQETSPVKSEQIASQQPNTPSKVEEKKSPSAPSSKEEPTSVTTLQKPAIQSSAPAVKSEEPTPTKVETSALKSPVKVSSAKPAESPEKIEIKTPITSRTTKRKVKELKEPRSATSDGGPRSKRNRTQTTPYQSPLPEYSSIVKISKTTPKAEKDDKLIVFYKHEFLAVRNAEGSFFVCQAMQNIYKTTKRIRIRWLSQDQNNGEIYSPDFYDFTDFDCILTNLNLNKVEKNKYQLTKYELLRTENILKRAIDVEAGVSEKPPVTEEHPDGLDLSLYRDEAQLKKRKSKKGKGKGKGKGKRQRKKSNKDSDSDEEDENESDDEDDEDSDDSSESESDSEEKTTSSGRKIVSPKKRSGNKSAMLQTPTVPKGPSRAERALNRSKGPVGPSTSASASGSSATPKKMAEPKKGTEVKKPSPAGKTPVAKSPVASTSSAGQSKAKSRGATATSPVTSAPAATTSASVVTGEPATSPSQDPKTTAGGRPKRAASTVTTATPSTNEGSSTRKKPRGRA